MIFSDLLHLPTLIYNKFYADLLRSRYYARLVEHNPRKAVNIKWRAHHHKSFPWNNPQTLDEKITWLQVMTDTSEWTRLADKLAVRQYVTSINGGGYLTSLYGVWERAEDINFDELPKSFVIKCTHDCGSTIVVKDKDGTDLESVRNRLAACLKHKTGVATFEPHYFGISPRIIAEEMLQPDATTGSMVDYKMWCLGGDPYLCLVCYDRERNGHPTVDLYQLRPWQPYRNGLSEPYRKQAFKDVPEPVNLDEMIDFARKLAKGHPAVRVDMYNINEKLYFGEMTFTGAAVNHYYFSDDLKLEMGRRITLPMV